MCTEDERWYHIEPRIRHATSDMRCPRDDRMGAAFVDSLSENDAGVAKYFVTMSWGQRVREVAQALLGHFNARHDDSSAVFLWMDTLCINQHRLREALAKDEPVPYDEFKEVFISRLRRCGHTVVCMLDIKTPSLLTRSWSMFEWFISEDMGVPTEIIFSQGALDEFKPTFMEGGVRALVNTLPALVRVQDTQASVAQDKITILKLITETRGIDEVNARMNEIIKAGIVRFFKPVLMRWMDESLTEAAAPADPERRRRLESELLGISLDYVLGDFAPEGRAATGKADPNFREIAPYLCYGSEARGFGRDCPRDGLPGCSFVDAVSPGQNSRATHFLSWVWQYKLSDFVSALQAWVEKESLSPGNVYLWVCFFCNNQFRIEGVPGGPGAAAVGSQSGAADLDRIFESRLREIGRVVALLDSWRQPRYLTRVWCVFEQFTAVKLDIPVKIILPKGEAQSFKNEVTTGGGLTSVRAALGDVDVSTATAFLPADEEKVKDKIRSQFGGFGVVNKAVMGSMAKWCGEEVAQLLAQ